MKKKILPWLCMLACLSNVRAEGLPDLGDTAQSKLSPSAERHLGEQFMRDYRFHDTDYVDDAEVEAYLNRLGSRLVATQHDTQYSFEFFALRNPLINAFAMPGGFIGVHTGLILTAQSESELASVLAHEIGHIEQHHMARMAASQGQSSLYMLASILVAILAANKSSAASEAAIATGQAAAIQTQLSFSREYEREADRIGMQILTDAGLDVRGMPSFFERMQKVMRTYENNAPVYFRTHPLTTERISDMASRVQKIPYRQVKDSFEFLLVKAKLEALQGAPQEAIARFAGRPKSSSATDTAVREYGLARAYLRSRDFVKAHAALNALRATRMDSAMIETLAAELAAAQDQPEQAAQICRNGRKRYSAWKPLLYCEAEEWITAKQAAEALTVLNDQLTVYTQDYRLYGLQAQAYALQGKRALQHRAQAEVYALQGNLPTAIEQLDLAQRAGDGDFYELSAIDARMRELKAKQKEEAAEKH